jgi:hypothetical protein
VVGHESMIAAASREFCGCFAPERVGKICQVPESCYEERNHQGLDNEPIVAKEAVNGGGKVIRLDRLGGLLSFYYREAA